jgi:hypothetical protein
MKFPWTRVLDRQNRLNLAILDSETRIKNLVEAYKNDILRELDMLRRDIQELNSDPGFSVEGVMDKTVEVFEAAVKLRAVDAFSGGPPDTPGTSANDIEEQVIEQLKNIGVEIAGETPSDDKAVDAFMGRDV